MQNDDISPDGGPEMPKNVERQATSRKEKRNQGVTNVHFDDPVDVTLTSDGSRQMAFTFECDACETTQRRKAARTACHTCKSDQKCLNCNT